MIDNFYKELKGIVSGNPAQAELRQRIILRRLGAISRCYNPKNDSYQEYGARGIDVCDEWREHRIGAQRFVEWFCKELAGFANKYKNVKEALDELEIDRINNRKGYSPQNCQLLEHTYNQYTTLSGARCAKFKGLWIPLWYCCKMMGIDNFKDKNLSDKIASALRSCNNGLQIQNTHFMFCLSKSRDIFRSEVTEQSLRELLESVRFLVWYDFRENPLDFARDTMQAQCPKCDCGKASVVYDEIKGKYSNEATHKYINVKCDSCDFSEILIKNNKTPIPNIYDSLRELPIKTFNQHIKGYIREHAEQKDRMVINQRRAYDKRQYRKEIDADFAKEQKEKQRHRTNKYEAKKQILQGKDLSKIRKRDTLKKLSIFELKTRKAVRERLKKESHLMTEAEIKKARALMTRLLRKEKSEAKKRNPAGYYARLKRYNDNRTKRIRGDDYAIINRAKGKGNEKPLYELHKDAPAMPRKKAVRKDYSTKPIYYTTEELKDLGFLELQQGHLSLKQEFKPKEKPRKEVVLSKAQQDLITPRQHIERDYSKLESMLQKDFLSFEFLGKKYVWNNENDRIFCKCGSGLIGLDLPNKKTTQCQECGVVFDYADFGNIKIVRS